jgi:hypothetical protein
LEEIKNESPAASLLQGLSEMQKTILAPIEACCIVFFATWFRTPCKMGCEPYSGEHNAKVVGRWIRKVEETMIQIKIPHDLRVYYATQLLSDGAMTW